MKKQFVNLIRFGVVVGIISAAGFAFASSHNVWIPPQGSPPANNVEPPVNVSSVGQIKGGGLTVAENIGIGAGLTVLNGNLGIGTANPLRELHIIGRTDDYEPTGGPVSGNANILMESASGSRWNIYVTEAGDFKIRDQADGGEGEGEQNGTKTAFLIEGSDRSGGSAIRILPSRDLSLGGSSDPLRSVGIGTGSSIPQARLQVAGCSGTGCAIKPGGGAWASPSDLRLKNVQRGFTRGSAALMSISPVYYNYLDSTDTLVGVIAQEVEQSIPEAVSEGKDGYLLVNNDPIIWTMLNAIKEQQKQIEELQKQIEILKK